MAPSKETKKRTLSNRLQEETGHKSLGRKNTSTERKSRFHSHFIRPLTKQLENDDYNSSSNNLKDFKLRHKNKTVAINE
ncbi:hypothetical protein TNCV_4416071 [Trichonephila clavipes]|uniref:Uncharacterized protein n=1 Tax=Trichonephila clavipes TaxID=2585209 RepID=A0A8X6S9Q5_TRICX|nr:hypothetical protein TNCV_4416071 [Trichonephila clavipes]